MYLFSETHSGLFESPPFQGHVLWQIQRVSCVTGPCQMDLRTHKALGVQFNITKILCTSSLDSARESRGIIPTGITGAKIVFLPSVSHFCRTSVGHQKQSGRDSKLIKLLIELVYQETMFSLNPLCFPPPHNGCKVVPWWIPTSKGKGIVRDISPHFAVVAVVAIVVVWAIQFFFVFWWKFKAKNASIQEAS